METPSPQTADAEDFRSGFVALLGEANVGKSTLLNALLDFKLAIVTPKAQTTRDRIRGIYNDARCQIVFVDTPGVMEPRDAFNEALRDSALAALEGADAAFHLVDARSPRALPDAASRALVAMRKPVFLVVNKIDLVQGYDPDEPLQAARERLETPLDLALYRNVFCVSALHGRGLDALLDAARAALPAGPPLYDPDDVTDRDMRFLAAEIVREKVLENCREEVPYSVAARTEEFQEREDSKHFIRVVVYVEHNSQKGIVIGKGGAMLRKIGAQARADIERMADHPVFLELWVKVRKNWRKKESDLREFGYLEKRPRGKKQLRRKR